MFKNCIQFFKKPHTFFKNCIHFSKTVYIYKMFVYIVSKTRIFQKLAFFKNSHFSKTRIFQKLAFFKNSHFLKTRIFQKHIFLKIPRFKAIKRAVHVSRLSSIMAANTLNEWSDGEDDFVWQIDENLWEWDNTEDDDDLIRNIDENNILGQPIQDDLIEWNNTEDDDLIRNINENDILGEPIEDDLIRDSDLSNEPIHTGRGEKRKSDEPLLPENDFYHIESVKKHHSKKFGMTATDHIIQFNNVLHDVDLLESHERTRAIFEHMVNDVTRDMNEKDQIRFVLRSEQLDTPISVPFLPVERLTTERIFSQIERVIQSNQDFRLNDTVSVDIIHVVAPQGSGKSKVKRTVVNIREYLKKKKSIITINNDDNLCLARALVVAVAKIENDPKFDQIRKSNRDVQLERALQLHQAANVPLAPCGMDEVELFQKYFTKYQIIVVSGDHNDSIIYPHKPPGTDEKQSINLYYHNKHFDVITTIPGFLNRSYFCHRCHKSYDHTSDHLCPAMCGSCRAFGCVLEGDGIVCNECERLFKNQACYDHHKEPINGGGRSVCEVVRKCEKCGKAMDVRKINPRHHICGKKCRTCGVILNKEDAEHQCYIQQLEQEEESSYNHLLFFDFEATQEHGIHCPNLCVVHDEEREVALFQGEDTVKKFCEWLLTPEHEGCIVVAHNFQGYDGYFITKYLIENAIHYEIIYRGAKSLSMTIPMFNIKFIDSLNFIPMSLAKFPKTFGQDELCKGYFPHLFNKEENQNYVGPIPCQNDYGVNFKKPEERKAFIAWHQEQVPSEENNYLFDFRKEIIKYCRSDVDIMAKCCLLYREMFRKETDIDPFDKALTIASYCHQVYRTNFLKKDTIAVFNHDRQLKTKQSNVAVKWLSYIMEKEDIHIQHVRNGGEKRFGNYSLDGYCEETHTAYEFQGCFWHGKDLVMSCILIMEKYECLFSFFRLSRMLQK